MDLHVSLGKVIVIVIEFLLMPLRNLTLVMIYHLNMLVNAKRLNLVV